MDNIIDECDSIGSCVLSLCIVGNISKHKRELPTFCFFVN